MNYNEMVYQKMSTEYDRFKESVRAMTGAEAITHAYESVLKEDILSCFGEYSDMNLSPKQAKALLAEKYPLDCLYQQWMETDCSYMDMLRDCISDGISDLEQAYQRTKRDAR